MQAPMKQEELINVGFAALVEDQASSSPIVLLHDPKSNKILPIWIGDTEARAISFALNKTGITRPMTHRLVLEVMAALGGKLVHIVITDLKKNTYYADICIMIGDRFVHIDSRPSDAIAIAVEAGAPIFVVKRIMDSAAQANPFPGIIMQQREQRSIKDFKEEDLKKLGELLEKARQREEKSAD
jgi:hypothetical protein